MTLSKRIIFGKRVPRQCLDAPMLPPADQLQGALTAFLDQHRIRVEHVFRVHQDVDAPTFLSQPESTVLFYLLDQDQYQLAELWGQRLPDEELAALATAWGTPLALG